MTSEKTEKAKSGGDSKMNEEILDATAGGRGIWLKNQKDREDVLFIDKREEDPGFTGQEGRTWSIEPDETEDFRDLPYGDETFNLVVFDPPHKITDEGMEKLTGYVEKSYGALKANSWRSDIRQGFEELFRVLKPGGVLVFKFSNYDVDFKEVLKLAPMDPLFGTTTKKNSKCENRWFVFYKSEVES